MSTFYDIDAMKFQKTHTEKLKVHKDGFCQI